MPSKLFVLVGALLCGSIVKAQQNADVLLYVNTYKQLAVDEMQRTGVPAAITLAQGIHESMAGKSDLVARSNNHFGIKCKSSWTGDRVYHDDDARGECFRSYSNAADSYRDHSDFLKNSTRYASLFSLDPTDYEAWAYGLKKAGYATNSKYPQILIDLIDRYNLERYTLIAMGEMQPDEDMLAANGTGSSQSGPVFLRRGQAAPAQYPQGEFEINRTKVIYVKAGTPLLTVAREHTIQLGRLLDFNDLGQEDVLTEDQLIFLRRKRRQGNTEYHVVQPGETIYTISQAEGIRLQNLLDYNQLSRSMQPASGERLYLKAKAPTRPRLSTEVVAMATPAKVASSPAAATATLTHTVQTKETLYSIARRYNVTVEDIRRWNSLDSTALQVGQTLVIHTL